MLARVAELPNGPLEAAARFYAEALPALDFPRDATDLVIVFAPADHTHRAWRLAAVQELARKYAPRRVNAVASDDETAIAAAADYLAAAPGVTGQYFPLDSQGAGMRL